MKNSLLTGLVSLIFLTSTHAQHPVVSTMVPNLGPVGTVVTISGENFGTETDGNIVYFGPTKAEVISASENQIVVIVPNGATYEPVTVSVNGLSGMSPTPFRVTFQADGTFENRVDYWVGGLIKWATTADIDGDGRADIIGVDETLQQVYVWLNYSAPGFFDWSSFGMMFQFQLSGSPYGVETADLNEDGKLDVIVTNSNGSVDVLLNRSSWGVTHLDSPISFPTASTPYFIAVKDIDDDGKQDLAVACANNFATGYVSILKNTSTGGALSFAPSVNLEVGSGGVWCVRLEDMDADRKPDVLVTSGGSAWLSIFKNVSTSGSIDYSSFQPRIDFTTGLYPAIMTVFDFNGDSKPDVVVGNAGDNSLSLFQNDATPGLLDAASLHQSFISTGNAWNPTAGDVNGDGNLDILVRNSSGNVTVFKNETAGGVLNFQPYEISVGGSPLAIYVGDLDNDGKSDLMMTNEGYNTMTVMRNMVIEAPPAPTLIPAGFISNSGFEARWTGDNVFEYRLDVSRTPDFSQILDSYHDHQVYGSPWTEIRTTVAGLDPDSEYYYRVRAIRSGVASENSTTGSVRTKTSPFSGGRNVWAKHFGDAGDDEVQAIVHDEKGNLYIAGHFTGSFQMGNTVLESRGDFDIFIAKLDPQGNVLWAESIGGNYIDNEVSLAVDKKGLYLAAQFSGEIDVDPGSDSKIFFNEGSNENDSFFGKYDRDTGGLIWANKLTDAMSWSSTSIGVDKTGVYLTGRYYGTVDLDPSAGVALFSSNGDSDIFFARYTEKGAYVWGKSVGGWGYDTPWGLVVDESGIYIHGYNGAETDFDPGAGEHLLWGVGGFFARYETKDGKFRYAKSLGNGAVLSLARFQNDIYVAADFHYIIDADPGEGEYIVGDFNSVNSGLVGKYSMKDGSFQWAQAIINNSFAGPRRIMADASGIYVSGYFQGCIDFDGGPSEENRTSWPIDAFAAHYAANDGSFRWAKTLATAGRAVSIAATLNDDGFYLAGLFGDMVNFDPYEGNAFATSIASSNDMFIARYEVSSKANGKDHETSIAAASEVELIPEAIPEARIFPNPVASMLTIDLSGFDSNHAVYISITDPFGKTMLTKRLEKGEGSIDVSQLPSGVHLLRANQGHKKVVERFVKL